MFKKKAFKNSLISFYADARKANVEKIKRIKSDLV